jgi:L-malate glycosyltransferase
LQGHVSNIDQVWETNQVLVLPSLSEGTPLALMEAMLSGRTAVATDVGDNGRYVLDGETGFLAQTASFNCLTASLEELWNNRGNLMQLGKNAFHHSLEITNLHPEGCLLNFIEAID